MGGDTLLQLDVMILSLRPISSLSGEPGQIELADAVDRRMMAVLRQSFAVIQHIHISEVAYAVALPAEAGQSLLNASISLTLLAVDLSSIS